MTAPRATGLVVGADQYVYDVVRPWGTLPQGWSFGVISHVAVDSKDRVYFYQRKDPPILVFDPEGNFLRAGAKGGFWTLTASTSDPMITYMSAIATSTRC